MKAPKTNRIGIVTSHRNGWYWDKRIHRIRWEDGTYGLYSSGDLRKTTSKKAQIFKLVYALTN